MTPQISAFLTVVDPEIRLAQYAASLRRWVGAGHQHGFRVVLVENSGADLLELAELAGPFSGAPPLLLAAPEPSAVTALRGKGANEGQMVDYALAEIRDGDPEELIYKCTGRLFVPNFASCAVRRVSQPTLVAEVPRVDYDWLDSRLFGATRALWQSLLVGLGETVDDRAGINFENVLAGRARHIAATTGARLRTFRSKPRFEGVSGSSGADYGGDRASRIRARLLDPLHRLHRAMRSMHTR